MKIESSFFDKFKDECGVVGIYGVPDASRQTYLSLFALQHRGQEASGIVTFERHQNLESEDVNVYVHKSFGLIADNISDSILNGLRGHFGIGHVRYSTAGGALAENIQPFQFKTSLGPVAIAHNGNLTNANQIRMQLEASGSVFQSTSDTEVLVHLIARSSCSSIRERIGDALRQVKGAYSLTIMTSEAMYAARDPGGVRPLALGTLDHGFIVASETCAFDLVGAQFIRDIDAGEVVEMTSRGVNSWYPQERRQLTFCSFEPIYFARPDSLLHGESIYLRRKRIGVLLAKECPIDGDVVIPIPDSGMAMAEGFSQESKIPMAMGLVRNHYIGRTFIQPSQMQRDMGVRLKLNTVKSVLKDKRVVVVDDSLVRGTTAARILKLIKDAGAREIHFRIGAPPITHSCFYGVDTPKRQDLLAAQKNVEEIRDIVGADSIGFISLEGLRKALEETHERAYCMACFTGIYPEDVGLIIPSQPTDICGTGLYSKK